MPALEDLDASQEATHPHMKPLFTIVCLLAGFAMHAHGADDVRLPKVLIIGDSISIGYTRPLKEILNGKATVLHNPGNAEDSGNGLKKLDAWLGDTKWDVIHFNHGLHDLKYVDENGKNANKQANAHLKVEPDEYGKNLDAIVVRLKKTGAKLIFATTTPVPEGTSKPLRMPDDVERYNKVALEVMKKHEVTVNDLHALVLPKLGEWQRVKDVHYKAAGYRAMSEEAAAHILKALGRKGP
jgi:hypothetical protein